MRKYFSFVVKATPLEFTTWLKAIIDRPPPKEIPQRCGLMPILDFSLKRIPSSPALIEVEYEANSPMSRQIKFEQKIVESSESPLPIITYGLFPMLSNELEVVIEWQNFMLNGFISMLLYAAVDRWPETKDQHSQWIFRNPESNAAFEAEVWRNYWLQEENLSCFVNAYLATINLQREPRSKNCSLYYHQLNTWRNKLRHAYSRLPGTKTPALEAVQRNITTLELHGAGPGQIEQIQLALNQILIEAKTNEDTTMVYRVRTLEARLRLLNLVNAPALVDLDLEPITAAVSTAAVDTVRPPQAMPIASGRPSYPEDLWAATEVLIKGHDKKEIFNEWKSKAEHRLLVNPREAFDKMLLRYRKKWEKMGQIR